ncbi:hypothetical protein F4604DRAFT_2021354 [Suillus subluteus]|nr:hypothetical protein F4604DRAFT_2021354 [Suillus subluteus]
MAWITMLFLLAFFAFIAPFTHAIKFALPAARLPIPKCIWNAAHTYALVIITANVGPRAHQWVDIKILDSTPHRNVYLSKRNIKDETRLALCFKNYVSPDIKLDIAQNMSAIANQDSLSMLETEMRKLEGVVKDIECFADTNCQISHIRSVFKHKYLID